MPNADGGETREEYEERLRIVRATQIFGDTPTDPTIGDVVVPAHDEEAANVAAAEAADLSPEEAKRQLEPLDAEEVDEAADEDDSDLTAAEKIEKIEAASSVEEVDRLVEGDDRVTVQRAADKKRSSWA